MSPLSAQQNNTEGTLIPWGWRHSVEKSSAFVRLTLMHREEVSPPIRLGGLGERHEQILHLSSWKMGVRYSQSKKWYTGTPRTPVNYALWLRTPLVRFSWANSKTSYVFPFYASSFIFSYHHATISPCLFQSFLLLSVFHVKYCVPSYQITSFITSILHVWASNYQLLLIDSCLLPLKCLKM